MQIRLQNMPGMVGIPLTLDDWREAADRAGWSPRHYEITLGSTRDDYLAAIADVDVLVASMPTTPQLFPVVAPRLKLLFCTSAGLDRVPFDQLPSGVQVLNNSGVHGPKAGEFGMMALLMLANHIPSIVNDQRAHRWDRNARYAPRIAGKKLTIVGLGSLGGSVAEQAAHFGMKVTGVRARPAPHPACHRVVSSDDLDNVLSDTDFLFLACPLTAATRNILDRRRIALLPPTASVVNIGRGPLLDQDALCDALDCGRLAGALLDVFVPEPVPPDHRLWTTSNLLMTPHVSSDDPLTYNSRTMDVLIENLRAFEAGEVLPNLYDRLRGY